MRQLLRIAILALALVTLFSHKSEAQFGACLPGFCGATAVIPPPPTCVEGDNFIARTSGLDTTHINAYYALICGLVDDGIWTLLDVLEVYATQDAATAVLSLVNNTYTGSSNGAITFTADRGFTGINNTGTTTDYLNTGYAPPSANYSQNSAHTSMWSVIDVAATNNPAYGDRDAAQIFWDNSMYPKFGDGNAYFNINTNPLAGGTTPSIIPEATSIGHYLSVRTGANAMEGFKNGISIGTGNRASANPNNNIFALAHNRGATPQDGWAGQIAMFSAGAPMNGTQSLLYYNRLRTYMTTVGVP